MTEGKTIHEAARPRLRKAVPHVFVRDIERACAFYRDALGFDVDFAHGEPPFFAGVTRDGCELNLRCVDDPPVAVHHHAGEDLLSAAIVLDDDTALEALFLELQDAGVDFHQRLRTEPWSARTFIVTDPDGNLLLFAGPVTTQKKSD